VCEAGRIGSVIKGHLADAILMGSRRLGPQTDIETFERGCTSAAVLARNAAQFAAAMARQQLGVPINGAPLSTAIVMFSGRVA